MARVVVTIGTDEVPELWGTDLSVVTEGKVGFPRQGGPMVRVLDMESLTGTPVGRGAVTIEIFDDELIGGIWQLDSADGRLTVAKGTSPTARLSAAGFSGLLYGVLDPIEVVIRGLGDVPSAAVQPLATLFPRQMPYLYADF